MSGFIPADAAREKVSCIRENLLYSEKLTSFRQRKKVYNLRNWCTLPSTIRLSIFRKRNWRDSLGVLPSRKTPDDIHRWPVLAFTQPTMTFHSDPAEYITTSWV
ncbi:hypothetical protein AVEN_208082-1 [Araneus ventricosus]|uniref:Uncharacterized protein n=1 Tax=Araneus ventricosus TaxID=182803 RepID=A0A4Y2FWA8_ARAVE|nr:hypothetical protein AVEN_208082-1 [Araneus ventricosus]